VLLPLTANAALVAHWKFDEASGPTATDVVGGFNGTLAGSATFVPGAGVSGGAISLNAVTGDLVNMGDVLSFGTGSFSVSVWVKTAGTGQLFPVAKHQSGFGNGYFININGTGGAGAPGKAMFYVSSAGDAPISTTTVNDNTWHQIVGVFEDGVSRRIYVDGLPVEATSTPLTITTNTAPLLVGGFKTSGPLPTYTGLVDELRLYDHALADSEIQDLFNCLNGICLPCGNGTLDPGEQCDDGNAANGDCCSAACAFESAAAVCRTPAGVCDPAEHCTGSSAICPSDVLTPNGTVCADDGEVCTLDLCNGVSPACQHPAGNAGTSCRPGGGPCNPREQCDGANPTCPADAFANAGTSCPSDGEICTSDVCNGAGACTHPAGNAGTLCRADAGQCDVAETCNGVASTCPPDLFEPNGAGCNDGAECTILDQCVAGVCSGNSLTCGDGNVQLGCGETCDDSNAIADDGCDPLCHLEPCPPTPEAGCRLPTVSAKSQLKMKKPTDATKSQLQWKWPLGAATTIGDFGNPLTSESYYLCIYDAGVLVSTTLVESATGCPTCWKSSSTSFAFKDKSHTPNGAEQLKLKSGVDGKAQIQFKGKGANLQMPVGGRTGPVVVQLQPTTQSACWEAVYSAPFGKNDGTSFVDKAD
jgi:cysteine-rich repeat protein